MPDLFQRLAPAPLDRLDRRVASWMASRGPTLLRWALGIVFIWFGALKLFAGASPAEALVKRTVYWFDPDWFFPLLGVWEIAIGAGLLARPLIRLAILLLLLQMPGTFLPLVVVPEACWVRFPFVLTLEGQYIVKNLVLIAAALVVGGTVRREETAR
jgi:uncharacterized membrane protein YkgB